MRNRPESNVFSPVFLDVLNCTDRGGFTVYEATYAGPWHVVEHLGAFAVTQETAECLLRSPQSLSLFLEAGGYESLNQAGRLLARRRLA